LKYKRCCLSDAAARAAVTELRPLETLDATNGGCRWTIYARTDSTGAALGEVVEHACDGERFEIDRGRGWLRNGKPVSMFSVLDAIPPQLNSWTLRTALDAISDVEFTPLGLEVARVLLLGAAINEAVGVHAPGKLARIRAMTRRRAAA
jgi:hypothetical protein